MGEEGDACEDGRLAFYGFVVEREVVEEAPEDHAVNCGAKVADGCGAVFKNCEGDEGFVGEEFLIKDEEGQTGYAD